MKLIFLFCLVAAAVAAGKYRVHIQKELISDLNRFFVKEIRRVVIE
jgi:hypothetical protein